MGNLKFPPENSCIEILMFSMGRACADFWGREGEGRMSMLSILIPNNWRHYLIFENALNALLINRK